MAVLDQYTYIFAVSILFAFLDGWNIGANDVANSFATSVSSRSLTMMQAMLIASVCEFGGALLAGARTTNTIRSNIIKVQYFAEEPSVLMLGMLCALIGSSTYLTFATRVGLPVSTTHCIVGGIIGVGFATVGASGVDWSWKGVAQIFAAWGIAPAIAGAFGAILFTITKYFVLKSKNPLRRGMITVPFYFGITSGILVMVIVWKGAANLKLDTWSTAQVAGCIFGVAGGVALWSIVFLLPYLHRKLEMEDWTLKPWHIVYGPLLLRRGPVPPKPEGVSVKVVQDYYRGHKTRAELEQEGYDRATIEDLESKVQEGTGEKPTHLSTGTTASLSSNSSTTDPTAPAAAAKPWYTPTSLFLSAKHAFLHGVSIDVVSAQSASKQPSRLDRLLAPNLSDTHARSEHYDNKTEHLFSFLQVLTAATASFAHGANDVSNAMGPLSSIYHIWNSGTLSSKAPVPIWVLLFGGSAIVIGLWTYGYNIMRNLGNRITLHSPSRGFCMELGAALTVVLATRLALPISTTQCIVGATVGVGLCAGDLKAINWRMVAWAYLGWFITLPCTAVIAGVLMGFVVNAPQWGKGV